MASSFVSAANTAWKNGATCFAWAGSLYVWTPAPPEGDQCALCDLRTGFDQGERCPKKSIKCIERKLYLKKIGI